MGHSERTFNETQLREVLDRALNIQVRRSGEVTLPELHQLANEVGISREVIDIAVLELDQGESPQRNKYRWPRATLRLLGFGVVLGLGTSLVANNSLSDPFKYLSLTLFAGILCSGAVAATGTRAGKLRAFFEFEIKNIALWGAMAVAAIIFAPGSDGFIEAPLTFADIILRTVKQSLLFTGIVGGGVAFALADREGRHAAGAEGLPLRRRIADRLKNWIDEVLARIRIAPTNAAETV